MRHRSESSSNRASSVAEAMPARRRAFIVSSSGLVAYSEDSILTSPRTPSLRASSTPCQTDVSFWATKELNGVLPSRNPVATAFRRNLPTSACRAIPSSSPVAIRSTVTAWGSICCTRRANAVV
jgi:hypothetical protein